MEENMNSSPELPEINSAGHVGISPNVYDDGSVPEVPDEDLEAEIHSEFSKLQVANRNCSQTFSPIGSARTSPEQGLHKTFFNFQNPCIISISLFICIASGWKCLNE